jgi:hypothetical protein
MVTGQGGGTLTWLPSPGQVISQAGALPDRQRRPGGAAVRQCAGLAGDVGRNDRRGRVPAQPRPGGAQDADSADISALGRDYYSWETAYGVQQLEEHLGVSGPPGTLSLGQVVFQPQALRVSQVTGRLGGPASGPVLAATSGRHVVMIPLDVSQQSEVKAGDAVTVTLPDGTITPGTVSSVGAVASTTSGQQGQGPATTTIPVTVALTDPSAAGTLDQAPVTVNITTATASNVLAVPVTALLAQSPGGYEVEVVGPGNTRRWVPVTPGPVFDDVNGLVQVTGALTPGQRVVVASS